METFFLLHRFYPLGCSLKYRDWRDVTLTHIQSEQKELNQIFIPTEQLKPTNQESCTGKRAGAAPLWSVQVVQVGSDDHA